MRVLTYSIAVSVLLAFATSHVATAAEVFCKIKGPRHLLPSTIHKLRSGMKAKEIEKLLGKPHYSPAQGQYYYGTNDNCAVMGGLEVYCGYVLDFVNDQSEDKENPSAGATLEDCYWGPIPE